FYPFTFPVTVGPGVIVVVLTLSADASGKEWEATMLAHLAIFVAVILLTVLQFLSYAYAPRLQRMIPTHVASGVQRLVSFILLCIGAQIAWGGVATLLRSLPRMTG
ncbi:MAG: MarC family protein, partial [Gemmatimonadales bacterium]